MKKFLLLFVVVGCISEKEKAEFEYTPFSQSVIHFSVPNNVRDTISIEGTIFTNIPPGGNNTRKLSVIRPGEYFLVVESDRPAKSALNIGKEQYNVFVIPNDTSHITISSDDDEWKLSFEGKSKQQNDYYLEKKKALGYADIRVAFNKDLSPSSTYNLLKANADSVISQELNFFHRYTSSQELPKWFVDYEHAEIVYAGAGYKTYLPGANEFMKWFSDILPDNYFDFLDDVTVNNPKASLSSYYFWFLNDYFARDLSKTENLSRFERVSKFKANALALSNVELSGETKQLFHKSLFSDLIQFYSDSLEIDSLASAFQVKDYKELVRLSNIRSRNEEEALNLHKGDTIPDFLLADELDSLVSIRTFQDQVLYVNFWATWCGPCIANIPNLNKLIEHYAQDPRIRFVNICLDSEKEKWLISIQRHQLKGINLYAEKNWNSKLRSSFNIKGIPHYMIINRGNIMLENFSGSAPGVKDKLDAVLAVTQ